jgi:hypothetical protein
MALPKSEELLGRLQNKQENNIKMDLKYGENM